jgi:hypothetical protein
MKVIKGEPKEYHEKSWDYILTIEEIGDNWTKEGMNQSFDSERKEGTESRSKIVVTNDDEDELTVVVLVMVDIETSKKLIDDYRLNLGSYNPSDIDKVGDQSFGVSFFFLNIVITRISNVIIAIEWDGGSISEARDITLKQIDKIESF